jgi:hypothetical protein
VADHVLHSIKAVLMWQTMCFPSNSRNKGAPWQYKHIPQNSKELSIKGMEPHRIPKNSPNQVWNLEEYHGILQIREWNLVEPAGTPKNIVEGSIFRTQTCI